MLGDVLDGAGLPRVCTPGTHEPRRLGVCTALCADLRGDLAHPREHHAGRDVRTMHTAGVRSWGRPSTRQHTGTGGHDEHRRENPDGLAEWLRCWTAEPEVVGSIPRDGFCADRIHSPAQAAGVHCRRQLDRSACARHSGGVIRPGIAPSRVHTKRMSATGKPPSCGQPAKRVHPAAHRRHSVHPHAHPSCVRSTRRRAACIHRATRAECTPPQSDRAEPTRTEATRATREPHARTQQARSPHDHTALGSSAHR